MKKYDFNQGWTFFKQGEETGRTVRLPHDAMIHEQRNPQSPGGSAVAHFPGGVYEYEKTFDAPETWANQHVVFQFEGVYRNAKVFINGKEAGGRPYGYIPFFVEADGFLNYGAQNTIRVIADNSALPNSRWYSGSGIYRPVWLWTGPKTRINIEGVKIATLSYSPARIKIDVSHTGGDAAVEILRKGTPVASGVGDNITLEIPNAKLWSDESPELYECRVVLKQDGVAVDEVTETFGIRFVEWNRNGLFINGKKTLLRGGCVHHDNGILGARCYAASEERRVRIMKQAGFNAIRSAHNPASKAMLAACDKYGVYMMDETWDMWYMHKNKCDYASDFMDNYKADIEAMVNRDFNHPSVILYSIGNEITEPFQEKGVEMARELAACFRALDKNRAVTGGISLTILYFASKGMGIYKEDGSGVGSIDQNKPGKQNKQQMTSSTLYNFIASTAGTMLSRVAKLKAVDRLVSPCMDALDIAGYNYAALRYPLEAKLHPQRVILGSETYPQDIFKNWELVKKYSYVVGDFMWTAWDYLGEAGLGAWAYTEDARAFNKPYPWLLADTGAIDILGNPGAEAEYAATVWGFRAKPWIGVRPVNQNVAKLTKSMWRGTDAIASWAWKNCEGSKAVVEVYTGAHTVELQLNGKCIGRKRVKACRAVFNTRYAPGKLAAVSFDSDGNELSRSELQSTRGKISIRIRPEKGIVSVGDIVYITVELAGENDVVECNADTKIDVSVEGGELLAFGSANPHTPENYTSGSFTTYYGKAQAVVGAEKAGTIRITMRSGDMLNASTEIKALDQNMT